MLPPELLILIRSLCTFRVRGVLRCTCKVLSDHDDKIFHYFTNAMDVICSYNSYVQLYVPSGIFFKMREQRRAKNYIKSENRLSAMTLPAMALFDVVCQEMFDQCTKPLIRWCGAFTIIKLYINNEKYKFTNATVNYAECSRMCCINVMGQWCRGPNVYAIALLCEYLYENAPEIFPHVYKYGIDKSQKIYGAELFKFFTVKKIIYHIMCAELCAEQQDAKYPR